MLSIKSSILFIILLVTSSFLQAQQWQYSGNNAFYDFGNVGIGTTNPGDRLEVASTGGNTGMRISNTGNTSNDFSALRFYQGSLEKGVIFTHQDNFYINRTGSGNLILANAGGNVGIGIANPTAKLEVPNNGAASFRVGITGNRANFNSQLLNSLAVIADNNTTIASNGAVAWDFFNNGNNPSWAGTITQHIGTGITGDMYGLPASNLGALHFQNVSNGVISSNGGNISISPNGTVSTRFLVDGTVLIGTTSAPASDVKLAVKGTVYSTKVKVTLTGWPDYVFLPTYRLRPLSEVEQYI